MSSPPRASGYFRTRYGEDFALVGTRLRRVSLAIFALALVAYPLVGSPFGLDLASQVFLNAIGALALMLLTGYAGQISLGHAGLLAAQRGINLHVIYALAWGLSTLTGALAGMLIALDSGLTGTMATIGLKAFPAALVGGLDSLAGALLGSLIVGTAEVLLVYINPLLSDVVPFLVLIAMLIVRPWGLFGTREELDRV